MASTARWRPRLRGRIRTLLQLNTVECGAACLAMVLSYHGRRTSISDCRDVCGGGRGGVSAGTIARAARSFGLQVRGFRPGPGLFEKIPLPAIAHWNGDHFVVVERWRPGRVRIVDPAWGRRHLTGAEFAEGLSDAVLTFEPGEGFSTVRDKQPSTIRRLFGAAARMRGIRALVGQILLATVLMQLFGLSLPIATKLVLDQILQRDHSGLLLLLGIGLGTALAAQVLTGFLRYILLLYLQGRLDWRVLNGFSAHLFRLPMRYFHQRSSGDIVMRLGSVSALRAMLTNQTVSASLDAGLVLTYLILMFVFDPLLALLVVGLLLLQSVVLVIVIARSRELMARNVTAQVRVNEYLVQILAGIATIKATGAERHAVDALSERIRRWTYTTLQRNQFAAAMDSFAVTLRLLTPVVVLLVGTTRVLDGQISVGTLIGVTWLASAILAPVSTTISNGQRLQMVGIQLDRVSDVLGAAPEREGGAPPPPPRPEGARLVLRNLSFRYDPHGPLVIRDLSAVIEPGQRVAVVGPSGAGKTTLAWLLLGIYEPTAGEIRFDGVRLSELSLPEMRQRFGVVLQEPFTMRAGIAENIAFARPHATMDDIIRASRIAEVHDEVSRLPLGYATKLAERGVGLSGGQLQRLSIARALVGNPSVVILDEATSHLDAATESRIVANLREVSCTQIVIAHRLSTIRDADLILVLRDGVLVESGTHEVLLARGDYYAALVAAQLGTKPFGAAGARVGR